MLHRFAALIGAGTASPPDQTSIADIFEDAHLLEPWAEDAMNWAVHHNLLHRVFRVDRPFGRVYFQDMISRSHAAYLLLLFVRRVTHPESVPLSCPELEARIKHDWAEVLNEYPHPPYPHPARFIQRRTGPFYRHHADHMRIDGYFGTYNGSVVLMMRSHHQTFNGDAPRWGVEVAGYGFGFIDGLLALVWNEGAFYSLPSAYELGLLTAADIGRAHSKFVEWQQTFGGFTHWIR